MGSQRESCLGPSLVSCPVPAAAGKVGTWHKGLARRGGEEAEQNEAWDPGAIVLFQRGGGWAEKRVLRAITDSANCPHYRSDEGQRVQRQNQRDGQKKWYTKKGNFKNTIPELRRRTVKAVRVGEPSHCGYASIWHSSEWRFPWGYPFLSENVKGL